MVSFILLFLFRSLVLFLLFHEVVHLILALFEEFRHLVLRDWRISSVHLQLGNDLSHVVLTQEKRGYIDVLP